MRVYLSSYRFGSGASALRRDGSRALVVLNALDEHPERLLSWDREADDLAALGYRAEELDLRDHWSSSASLDVRLTDVDLLWVVGGNAFVLARAATAAGLGAALARTSGLDYAGYSAGACLAGPDLRGIELMDDPATLPDGYDSRMPATTLGLVPVRVIPHAGTPEALAARQRLESDALDWVEIADGDDILYG